MSISLHSMRMQWTLTDFAEMDAKYDFKVSLAFVVLALNYINNAFTSSHSTLFSVFAWRSFWK